jgi:hypothetical protein
MPLHDSRKAAGESGICGLSEGRAIGASAGVSLAARRRPVIACFDP